MGLKLECKKCCVEIEPDTTNPYDMCEDCIEEHEEEQ